MGIEVGEYIRTKNGYIGKLLNYDENDIYFGDIECNFILGGMPIKEDDIKAHSKNIIDLIEVGDIVNCCEVINIYKPKDIWEPIEVEINSKCTRCFLEGEIKTILTHEQYEQNSYKI